MPATSSPLPSRWTTRTRWSGSSPRAAATPWPWAADETPHASSVTVKTGGESADFSTITGDTVTFNADGTAEVKAGITGGEKIEVTGLPANTGYTITESGDTASGYTTTWDGITKTSSADTSPWEIS